jgi:hypothetical protein
LVARVRRRWESTEIVREREREREREKERERERQKERERQREREREREIGDGQRRLQSLEFDPVWYCSVSGR